MEYRFDFDEYLPDLPMVFDLEAVGQLFQERWPSPNGSGNAPGKIRASRMQDVKYYPTRRCVITYEIQVEPPDQASWETIGVVEVTPFGITHRLFMDDPKLPWLTIAIDPVEMHRRFAELLGGPGKQDGIELKKLMTIRYKPGLHCVFRYELNTPVGEQVFFGKLFAEEGDRLMEMETNLFHASQERLDMPRIPHPMIYWPDLRLLVQPAVSKGLELRNYAFDTSQDEGSRERWIYRAGAYTGVLHASGVPSEKRRTFKDEMDDLHEYSEMVTKVNPKFGTRFEEAIAEVLARAKDLSEPAMVPSHGALRTDQFIIQNDYLVMIDLDGFCQANPARDVGNFLAYLCWKAIRQPEHASFVERAGQAFLKGYLETGGNLDDRWLILYQAASLLKIAGRRFRSLTFIEWPLVKHLLDAALAVIKDDQDRGSNSDGEDPSQRQFLHLTTTSNKTRFPAVFIDTEFPVLWLALNAEMMDENIAPLFLSPRCKEHQPKVSCAKLLAYKPGKRGVIRYEFSDHACMESRAIYGKLYPEPYLAERAYGVLKTLWEDVFYEVPNLGVSEPLGYIPELSMLVFYPSEGQLLGDAISSHPTFNSEVFRMMEQAGEWLATLHQHRISLEKQFQITSEYDNIRLWANLISTKYPQEAEAAWRVASYLLDRGENLHFDTHVPIHKDFHYEHILVNNCLTVFDFDEMRLGDPNMDLAHFCANFYLLAYRKNKHPSQFAKLQNRFLDSYTRFTGWRLDERFNYFYIYTCLKIAKQLCKLRGPRPWPEGEEQHAQVWLMLEQALLVLSHATNMIDIEKTPLPIVDFSSDRSTSWFKAHQISKSATSSEAIHVSHKLLS